MPAGRGLGLMYEVRRNASRPKRRWKLNKLNIGHEWPHSYGYQLSKSWKRHRKEQYKIDKRKDS